MNSGGEAEEVSTGGAEITSTKPSPTAPLTTSVVRQLPGYRFGKEKNQRRYNHGREIRKTQTMDTFENEIRFGFYF